MKSITVSEDSGQNKVPIPGGLQEAFNLSWQRFCENATEEIIALAQSRRELQYVWSASDFVSSWCIRNSQQLAHLITAGELDGYVNADKVVQRHQAYCAEITDEASLDRVLREFRQQQMVCLAWHDLSGTATLEQTMEGVSALAEASIQRALDKHSEWLQQKYGIPRDAVGDEARMVVLGLGKLGGGELNYSSDIDLIFAYDNGGQTDGNRQIDNQEYFIKLGRKIIGSLDRVDSGGFVFRTDMRLRPNGESGPISLSFAAMEHYYQTHGRDWERYALIKARAVAGDRPRGAELIDMLRPFVYRKYLDFSAYDSLREMKNLIERQLKSNQAMTDIKLGRGGIREIEFLAQNHQLIRGGREKTLQTTSLYKAMVAMESLGILTQEAHQTLKEAYRFLRNLEHRLQMVADRQTQSLPELDTERARIAMAMEYEGWEEFQDELETQRRNVHQLFEDLLRIPEESQENPLLDQLKALWLGQIEKEEAQQVLLDTGYADGGVLHSLLHEFRRGKLYQAFANIDRDRLDRLMPLALLQAGRINQSQRSITAFISVIEAIGRRSVYLSLLIENPLALNQLLVLCAASPWISRHIGRYPVVLDELLQPLDQVEQMDAESIRRELDHRLQQIGDDDEVRMNTLREYQHAKVLRLASADIRHLASNDHIQNVLTCIAEVMLEVLLDEAIAKVEKKQGPAPGEVAIIAYGKFAGRELGYHSDLDIVVCYEPNPDASSIDAEYFFSRVGQRLVHLLTTRTHAGILYELDMRLRPSGRSGTLVTSLKAFAEYQQKSAWTWEHQALVRARVAVGSESMKEKFEQLRGKILAVPRDRPELKAEISKMRDRMHEANSQSDQEFYDIKLGDGGIVDIEFLLQYLVLAHCVDSPSIVAPRNTLSLIGALNSADLLSIQDAESLAEIYQLYLARSLSLKLMDQPVVVAQSELLPQRQRVTAMWNSTFG